jgi:hypothetical protein
MAKKCQASGKVNCLTGHMELMRNNLGWVRGAIVHILVKMWMVDAQGCKSRISAGFAHGGKGADVRLISDIGGLFEAPVSH